MELNFIKSGDYYIPDIQLQNPNIHLGKWGLMRKAYLRIAQPFLFSEMVLSETLYPHCAEPYEHHPSSTDETLRRDRTAQSRTSA